MKYRIVHTVVSECGKKRVIFNRCFIVLIIVVCFFSFLFGSGLTDAYSKYITKANTHEAPVEVSAFIGHVDAVNRNPAIAISETGNAYIGDITVSNVENGKVTQVAQTYELTVSSKTVVPENVKVYLENAKGQKYYAVADSERKNFSVLSPTFVLPHTTARTEVFKLYVEWSDWATGFDKIDFGVSVVFEQID